MNHPQITQSISADFAGAPPSGNLRESAKSADARFFGGLRGPDMERVVRVQKRLEAGSATEAIRRMSITIEQLLDHQKHGGSIVLCKQGLPDKVVWFV